MLPFLSGRGWGKVLKRGRRQSRGIVRWIATFAFVLSLTVWVASIWIEASVASRFASDPSHSRYWVFLSPGRVFAGENLYPGDGMGVYTDVYVTGPHRPQWSFGVRSHRSYRMVMIPLWSPTLLAGATAAWCWRRERQRRRLASAGSCPSCGYSRTGLVANSPCPECGVKCD